MIHQRKGVVFLDVDGVINALTWALPEPRYEVVHVDGGDEEPYRIIYDPYLVEKWNDLIDKRICDFYWLTTWGSYARDNLAPAIGLNDFPVLAEPPKTDTDEYYGRDEKWWKLQAIQEFYKSDDGLTRYVWVDDELGLEPVARNWCVNRRIYCISPRPNTGAQLVDINHAEGYFNPNRYAE